VLGTYDTIRAFAATLEPGAGGVAQIKPSDLEQFASTHVNWKTPARQPRVALMIALAHLASSGALDRRPGRANYWTWPPGHTGPPGVDPVLAGKS
jgi:hypothetical protein